MCTITMAFQCTCTHGQHPYTVFIEAHSCFLSMTIVKLLSLVLVNTIKSWCFSSVYCPVYDTVYLLLWFPWKSCKGWTLNLCSSMLVMTTYHHIVARKVASKSDQV